MHANTFFSPQLPQTVQARPDPFMKAISLCVHPFRGPEAGIGKGYSVSCCGVDRELPSSALVGPSADGVVIPVEGSEEESKGVLVDDDDVEKRGMAPGGLASTPEGAGEQSMLTAEVLESESRLIRR